MTAFFINKLNYSPENVHILNKGDGPTADEVVETFTNILIPKIKLQNHEQLIIREIVHVEPDNAKCRHMAQSLLGPDFASSSNS